MKGLENFCMYVDIEGKIFALLVTTPDTPSIPKNIIQNIIFFTKIMFVLKLIKQSTKLFEKNPLFSIKQPNLSISCKIR